MTHEVARVLAISLIPMFDAGVITVLSGLVKTATTTTRDGKTLRFPVPYQSESMPLQIENSALVPDSRQRAIVYFEDVDTDITKAKKNYTRYRSRLRLVCWYDASKYQTRPDLVQIGLKARIMVDIQKAKADERSPVLALKIIPGKMLDSVPALFSKYTYREERTQYLTDPYYAFGIDITAEYQINNDCKTDEILLPISTTRPV